MNLVHYLRAVRLEEGGIVRAVLDLCDALVRAGHAVTLITHDTTDLPEDWTGEPGKPDALLVPANGKFLKPIVRSALDQIEKRIRRADVVHLHQLWNPSCLQIGASCRRFGLPYVFSSHGMLDDWCMAQRGLKKRLYLAMGGRALLEHARAVHCTAQAEADQSAKWFPKGRAVVVPLIFDIDSFRELPGPELARRAFPRAFQTQPLILFLSRVHEKKGVHDLIDAARLLRDRGRTFTLAIAGTGEPAYLERLQRQVKALDLEDVVQFVGFVSGVEKVSLYEAADVFALPTNQENWGFVSLEAMAAGTVVLTTKGVDIWPELEASGGAVIVEGAAQPFADALETMLNDADRRSRMSRAAREWVLATLNDEEVIRRYERMVTDNGPSR